MKPKINQLINKSVVRLKRGSPTVLTCLGVAGVVATTVSAVMAKATPRATTSLSTAKQNRISALSASGYSTSEIAEALGVSTSTVSKYLNGKE